MSDVQDQDVTQDELQTPPAKPLEDRLDEINKKLDASTVVAQLTADPEIRKIMEARQSGQPVQVMVGAQKPQATEPELPPEPEDWEALSNRELVDQVIKRVAPATAKVVDERLTTINDTLNKITGHLQVTQAQKVNTEIEEVRSKYKDFDQFQQDMLDLAKVNPGLKIEELYIVAKTRRGVKVVQPTRTETERPTSSSSRPRPMQDREAPAVGRSGFDSLLTQALRKRKIVEPGDE